MCGNFIKWILCSFGWCFFYIVFICATNYQCKFKYIDFLVGVMMFKLCKNRWEFRDTERALQGSDVIVPSIIFPFFFFFQFSSFIFQVSSNWAKQNWLEEYLFLTNVFVCLPRKKTLNFFIFRNLYKFVKIICFLKTMFYFPF